LSGKVRGVKNLLFWVVVETGSLGRRAHDQRAGGERGRRRRRSPVGHNLPTTGTIARASAGRCRKNSKSTASFTMLFGSLPRDPATLARRPRLLGRNVRLLVESSNMPLVAVVGHAPQEPPPWKRGNSRRAKEVFQASRSKTIGRRGRTNPAPAVAFSVKLTMPPLRPPYYPARAHSAGLL
jgi:hypothetical protein